jgi:dihydrofolate reductase
MSLDGYIAGPQGEFDWIIGDPEIDFGAVFAQFDTLLVGRATFELMVKHGRAVTPGMRTIVFSRTLRQSDFPDVTIVAGKEKETVAALRAQPGKDVWLFGGGALFRSFLDMELVDTVEVAVMPVLLGGGIPLLPAPAKRAKLKLMGHKVYGSGIVSLEYSKEHANEHPTEDTKKPSQERSRPARKKSGAARKMTGRAISVSTGCRAQGIIPA